MPRALLGLRYVTDDSLVIHRQPVKTRNGKPAFRYLGANGRVITDKSTLARIQALAIPPAYEDVRICGHPRGHLQATGRDARGRKQYRYHPQWRLNQDGIKHARMYEFGCSLPRLRRHMRADLGRPGLPREKVLALVLSLMDATSARVGNAQYARSNGSFGLSTLRDRHARFAANGTASLHFPGKGGALHDVPIDDPRLARLVRKCQHLPGQHLFQYVDPQGRRHNVDSGQVNAYLHEQLGADYSAKDFRTWHATLRAYQLLLAVPRPDPATEAACRREITQVVKLVAGELRNTPAVCRKSYINPLVFTAWQAGKPPFGAPAKAAGQSPKPLLSLLRRSR